MAIYTRKKNAGLEIIYLLRVQPMTTTELKNKTDCDRATVLGNCHLMVDMGLVEKLGGKRGKWHYKERER